MATDKRKAARSRRTASKNSDSSTPKATAAFVEDDDVAWEDDGDGGHATYDYTDESGALLFQVVRKPTGDGKTFRQRRPDGEGGWIWNAKGTRRVA